MKILGIDTSTRFLCVGVYDDGKISEYNLETGTLQAALLLPSIKRILEALKWQPEDLDYLACGLGPGSFTGIRVGLSTVKGLAWALKKPIVGISTLDIIANNAIGLDGKEVVTAVDAKRELIYCARFKLSGSGLKRTMPYKLIGIKELVKKISPGSLIVGDALNLYKGQIIEAVKGARLLDKDHWYPKGRNIVALSKERIAQKKVTDTFGVKPVYLYPKECQIKNAKRKT